MAGILSGVRVISLAQQYPGPYCTMLLADLGADVILVEQPGRGDPARGVDGSSAFFAALNRGKRSVALDLKHATGLALAWDLLGTAQVLVEGFRPGVLERLGLGWEAVHARLPGLIYCSISGYGQDGPYRLRPGHDLSYQALAGLLAGALEDDPTTYQSPVAIGDLSSAMFATIGILAALLDRGRRGVGQHVDVSMTDGLVSWMGTTLEPVLNGLDQATLGREPAYGVFRCADGRFLTLSVAHEDHFWRNLCREIGRDDLALLTGVERRERREELREVLATCLALRPRDEWARRLEAADVAAGPVLSREEVVRDPQLVARGMFLPLADGSRRVVANPLKFSGAAGQPRPAPALGEHTLEIVGELGYGPEQIEAFARAGAIAPGRA